MTFELTVNRGASVITSLFGAFVRSVRAASARRAQRLGLAELLRMDPSRLDDLGLNQQDLLEAFAAPPSMGSSLNECRTTAAATVLAPAAA